MKTLFQLLIFIFPFALMAQFEAEENVVISKIHEDDIYLAGKSVKVLSQIHGDVVAAGSNIAIRDSVAQDVVVAGADVNINGVVGDDIRTAGGTVTISNAVIDDVILFAGEAWVTDEATIHGNLVSFSGSADVQGEVVGEIRASGGELNLFGKVGKGAKLYGGEVLVDGQIQGMSKIVAGNLKIGENAKFYGDVEYWTEDGEVDFGNALVGSKAVFNEDLKQQQEEISWKTLGLATFGFWIFYLLSAFLILLLLNWAFGKFFKRAVEPLEVEFWRGFGYGFVYLIGIPILIGICFIIVIGVPIGLVLLATYLFSLFFGHLVAASLLAQYWNLKNKSIWGFWPMVFLSLGIALTLRLLTFVPFLGILISILILALSYGLVLLALIPKKAKPQIVNG